MARPKRVPSWRSVDIMTSILPSPMASASQAHGPDAPSTPPLARSRAKTIRKPPRRPSSNVAPAPPKPPDSTRENQACCSSTLVRSIRRLQRCYWRAHHAAREPQDPDPHPSRPGRRHLLRPARQSPHGRDPGQSAARSSPGHAFDDQPADEHQAGRRLRHFV